MRKSELNNLLHQWAEATAPDAQTLSRLQECVHADLRGGGRCSVRPDPISSVGGCSPWSWVWAQAACVGWLLAVGLFWGIAGLDQVPSPWASAPEANLTKPACPAGRLGGVSRDATCRQLARGLHFHMMFLDVSHMPGLAGPYRSDALVRQSAPCWKLEGLAMGPLVWEVRKQNN